MWWTEQERTAKTPGSRLTAGDLESQLNNAFTRDSTSASEKGGKFDFKVSQVSDNKMKVQLNYQGTFSEHDSPTPRLQPRLSYSMDMVLENSGYGQGKVDTKNIHLRRDFQWNKPLFPALFRSDERATKKVNPKPIGLLREIDGKLERLNNVYNKVVLSKTTLLRRPKRTSEEEKVLQRLDDITGRLAKVRSQMESAKKKADRNLLDSISKRYNSVVTLAESAVDACRKIERARGASALSAQSGTPA